MKYLKFLFLIFFYNTMSAQEKCPNEAFLGKWIDDKFGIEIRCDRIIILDKINNWDLSQKRSDTYYFFEPMLINDKKIYVTWVQNYAMHDFFSKGKWQKTSSKQFRIFKLELNKDQNLDFSMSEKKVEVNQLKSASWNVMKEKEVFEKTFNLKKLN